MSRIVWIIVVLLLLGLVVFWVRGRTIQPPQGQTIGLLPQPSATCGTVKDMDHHVSLSKDTGKVRWHNTSGDTQTIHFATSEWVFVEPYADIVIDPGKHSPYYTVRPGTATSIPHSYDISPLRDDCPPGDPAITADP